MKYRIEIGKATKPLEHYWEMCIGSCHAATALRSDYREQIKRVHEELGFRYVRFHGLFDDDMSVVLADSPSPYMPSDKVKYNFMNTDNIFDYLVSIGMKPFLELGFMPRLLASGNKTNFQYAGNVTEPKDYAQWGDFIEHFTRHIEERYGAEEVATWFFEVWNEPNLDCFWTGTQEAYFKLYEAAARAIKRVDSRYQVGGPATSINAWIPEFKQFCAQNQVPLDFISTHHYPTDDPLWSNPEMDIMTIMAKQGTDIMSRYDKHIMCKMTKRAKEEAGSLPLYYTEWNISALLGDIEHDTSYAAALIARILHENIGMVRGYSWWTFSDIFEEMGQMPGEFHGGFGLQTYHGIRKPSYRLFEFFHRLGDRQYETTLLEGDTDGTTGVLATEAEGCFAVILYNQNTKAAGNIREEQVVLQIASDSPQVRVRLRRIDECHTNPRGKWETLGAPEYVNQEQLALLNQASLPKTEEFTAEVKEGVAEISVKLPEYSVAYLEIADV